ncbi:protein kinase domain-containing protein [Nocardia anaemiae]|uniref:protein kinase domain-containing protein n=1 Tax=Nocardia anaemiae TaxID=263910 RepID=UPI0007A4A77E|nr:serine/threonine-protein kinase [Nocardia anaemiae]
MVGVGDRIAGRYALRELFTLGGEGMAWRARDDDLDRDVVLKCPRPDDPPSAQRLRTAARNAAALRHQHIVGVYNIFEHDNVCWLVTEYVPGHSLAEIARAQRKLGPGRAAVIGEQIASALAHCHDRGILHCDISPENIILADDGDAWLTDFGSSLDLRNAGTGDTPDIARGKWRYLAPEVAAGGPAGPKSDVYALAASLLAVTERQRRPGLLEALLTQLTLPNPNHRPTAATAATRFARLEQPPRGWDRTIARRTAVGAAEAVAMALIVAASVAMPSAAALDPFGDPSSADPCALLDPNSLAEFGRIDLSTDGGNFDTCDLRVRQWGADFHPDIGQVRLTMSVEAPEQSSQVSFTRVGNITIASEPAGSTRCVRTLMVSPGANIAIIGERKVPTGPDPCVLADIAATHARDLLLHSSIPRRPGTFPTGSLAWRDACALLDVPTLGRVAGVDAVHPAPGFGRWSCRWDSTIDGHVTVRYDRDALKTAESGQPLTLAGLPSFRRSGSKATDDCIVQIQYRGFRGTSSSDRAEVVVVKFYGSQPAEQRCATVTDLATTVATSLTR